ncbi:MAG: hypothetical protein ACK4UN_01320 [Limisphaerales bacterium]
MQKNYNETPKGCSTTLPDTALMGIVAESTFGKKSEGHVGNAIVTFSLEEVEVLKFVIANRHSAPKAKEIFDKLTALVSSQDEQREGIVG